jgi:hypothetical protein
MWFMGAGTSRSARLPTANDIIWDLKLKHYCAAENQDIRAHDINNKAVKQRIQTYLDSRVVPENALPTCSCDVWSDTMKRFRFVDRKTTPHLYHCQRFVPEHLKTLLRDNVIWMSRPDTFNDPWDCKPCFQSDFADDPAEVERHVRSYADITRRHRKDIPEDFIARRQQEFRDNPRFLLQKVDEVTQGIWPAIARGYRVYCLGPDVRNLLLWSHCA